MKITSIIAMILVIVGALNWLLIGVFAFDLVAMLFGTMSIVSRIIYVAVGLSGLWMILYWSIYSPFKRAES